MNQPPKTSGHRSVHEALDPAGQSLADALKVSFTLLKALMVLLCVLYLVSGVFNVREQAKAIRLRFGRIVGQPGQRVLEPGGPYFSLPYPFDQVVTVPTSPQQIQINKAFWYETIDRSNDVSAAQARARTGPLHPEKDGSLLTGDAEVIHARWSVTYAVEDPIAYVKNVRNTDVAQRLVRAAAEQCIVFAVAQTTADQLIRSQQTGRAKQRLQEVLDGLASGIDVTTLSVNDPVFPLSVRPAVQEVLGAESVRAKLIDEAHERWSRILVGTAGEAYEPLLTLIEAYELASQSGDGQRIGLLERRLDDHLTDLVIPTNGQPRRIGGKVAQHIHEARAYRTQVIAQVRGEAEYFTSLLPQYRKNPRIVLNRLWQDTTQRILTGDIETMYVPRGQTYLELNRDPRIQLEREKRKLTQEQQTRSIDP